MANNARSHFLKIALKRIITFAVSKRQIFHCMTCIFMVNNVLFFRTAVVGLKQS